MTPVYTAESTLDAQLVQELLLSAGITAHVFGPNVMGAIPEVPASGQIRVVVEDGEAEQAQELIRDWDSEQAPEDEDEDEALSLDVVSLDDDGQDLLLDDSAALEDEAQLIDDASLEDEAWN